jgi:hypothetical protein
LEHPAMISAKLLRAINKGFINVTCGYQLNPPTPFPTILLGRYLALLRRALDLRLDEPSG